MTKKRHRQMSRKRKVGLASMYIRYRKIFQSPVIMFQAFHEKSQAITMILRRTLLSPLIPLRSVSMTTILIHAEDTEEAEDPLRSHKAKRRAEGEVKEKAVESPQLNQVSM